MIARELWATIAVGLVLWMFVLAPLVHLGLRLVAAIKNPPQPGGGSRFRPWAGYVARVSGLVVGILFCAALLVRVTIELVRAPETFGLR